MSIVQFNLLPDVKMEYVKAQRTQNLVISISFLVAAASAGLFLLTFLTANVVQKKQLSDADNDVVSYTKQLKDKPNVDRIVTVQNQLHTLVGLHQQKHITSRLFSYLPGLSPAAIQITDLSIDYATNTIQISGTSDGQQTVNTFIDSLKFTTFKVGDSASANAFSNVLETRYSVGSTGTDKAEFTVTAQFDPQLFSNNLAGESPKLTTPKTTSTRSVVQDPSNLLFNGNIKPSTGQGSN